MKNSLKRALSVVLALCVSALTFAACSPGKTTPSQTTSTNTTTISDPAALAPANAGKPAKIGVALYQDTGAAVTATKAYLESIQEDLNCTFVYTVLTQTDESTNLTKVQELIAAGVDGIISTMDLGTTSIIKECESAGVYLGGYICDFDLSFNTAYDAVFKSPNFVGASSDGQNPDDVKVGTVMFDSLIEYNEKNTDKPITHVAMAIFPAFAFPSQTTAATQFVEKVNEYNNNAAVKITVDPLNDETDVLPFSPMNSTYFTKHPGIQGIIGFAAGTAFIYPSMVAAGVDKDIKLFTTGFECVEGPNFGTKGTQTYQQCLVTQVESITYALVLILNKINDATYSDQPAQAERVSSSQIILNSDEDMATFEAHCVYFDGDASKSMFTGAQVLNMTAYANPAATYAELKEILAKMTIEDIAK